MRAVGIDVSSHEITIADVRQRFGQFTLKNIAHRVIPDHLVKERIFTDIPALANEIQQGLLEAQSQPIKINAVQMAISESVVFTHVFSFPRELDAKALQEGIAVQFSEYFPFEIEQTAYDWKVIQESDQTQMVIVAACERKYAEQVLRLGKEIGVSIAGLDIESVSAGRSMLPTADNSDTALLIDLGAQVTSMSIFGKEGLQSTFALDLGGKRLTEQISKALHVDFASAERLKKTVEMNNPENELTMAKMVQLVEEHCTPIVEEMKRTIRFFEASRRRQITEIILCGGSSLLGGLDDYFSTHLNRQVKQGNALRHIKHSAILDTEQKAMWYANAIGLGMGASDRRFEAARFNLLKYFDSTVV